MIEDERARAKTKWNRSPGSLFPLHNSLNKCGFIFVSVLASSDWKCDFWLYSCHVFPAPTLTHTPATALGSAFAKIPHPWQRGPEDMCGQCFLPSWNKGQHPQDS